MYYSLRTTDCLVATTNCLLLTTCLFHKRGHEACGLVLAATHISACTLNTRSSSATLIAGYIGYYYCATDYTCIVVIVPCSPASPGPSRLTTYPLITDYRLLTTDYSILTTVHFSLTTAYYLLRTTYYFLPTTYYVYSSASSGYRRV